MKPKYSEYRIENIEASKEKLKILNEALNKKYASSTFKINHIKSTFGTVCGFCRSKTFNYPARKVVFPLQGIEMVETYCISCFYKAGYEDSNKPKQKKRKAKK